MFSDSIINQLPLKKKKSLVRNMLAINLLLSDPVLSLNYWLLLLLLVIIFIIIIIIFFLLK